MQKRNNLRIFVVNDEQVIAQSLAVILRQRGFLAEAFMNPLKALAEAASTAPDLLLSDVMMPEMSGVELAIKLRAFHPDCKVLLFSGQVATPTFFEPPGNKGHDFELLAKPVHPTDLLAAIKGSYLHKMRKDESTIFSISIVCIRKRNAPKFVLNSVLDDTPNDAPSE